ncbi:MAG: glutamine-hydrolyzing carbamoyl-phosphate synthase small subunit [Chloroherpetonaceae bacterium]|nr:glutamine-hydrolyzing carbamoyl-phosphate synthase small subunit [Chloroherpetonaceae bacterium]MDW8438534.1 glutamine-hydrolyzing carbamoyl-phosphate synthase small subunit [Chloroherpetonaceae bacterium]
MTKARLVLENGTLFEGVAFGEIGEAQGEVVFNTSHAGYQEILTDPSYKGQIVCMTYPLIGNYGANSRDVESEKVWAAGFVVGELSSAYSNFDAERSLDDYLKSQGVMGISGIDTRRLTRMLRHVGAMRGVISTEPNIAKLIERAQAIPKMNGQDLASLVTRGKTFVVKGDNAAYRVVAFDYGMKQNILRMLVKSGCEATVVPAQTSAEDVLKMNPDGIFLSNGPGDPEAVGYAIETIKLLTNPKKAGREIPTFGICLGHQLLALAFGAQTYKLKFGHHGGNHPVKNLMTNKIEITAQNHGFAVDPKTLPKSLELTHLNLYDGTVEGFRHKKLPIFCAQYHPEAAPGPHDSHYLFDEFVKLMAERK